jgi:plastocyanin
METAGTATRLTAAAAILVGGLVHLQLYFDGYRDVPNANLGRSFLLDAFASIVIASALVVSRSRWVRLPGIGVELATLAGSALSRTDRGVFGFTERGWATSPQGPRALVAEVVAVVLLVLTFVPRVGAGRQLSIRIAAPIAACVVALSIVFAAAWNRAGESPAEADDGTVTIAEFAFAPAAISVDAGDTVTWVNRDATPHSVAAGTSFASDTLDAGETFTHTFDTAGTFDYICAIHPQMRGSVTVG